MKESKSIYEQWYNKFPFKTKVDQILFENYVIPKASKDNTLYGKFMAKIYGHKNRYYEKVLNKIIKKFSEAFDLDEKIIKTCLLFEIETLNLDSQIVTYSWSNRYAGEPTILKDLTIIQNFKNLKSLYCSGQEIYNLLPISNFPKLEVLTVDPACLFPIEKNKLGNICEFRTLPKLKYLCLRRNFISEFEYLESNSVEYLDISHTNLDDLSKLIFIKNVKWLDISKTKVVSVKGIEILVELEILRIGDLFINDFTPLLSLPKLKVVTYELRDHSFINLTVQGLDIIKKQKANFHFCRDFSSYLLSYAKSYEELQKNYINEIKRLLDKS